MKSVRLATFNLLHGVPIVGADANTLRPVLDDEGRVIGPPSVTTDADLRAAVRLLAADVLALQEVDVHQERSSGQHQVRIAAEEMGAAWWRFVPSVRGTPGVERTWEAADTNDHHGHDDHIEDHGPRYGIGLISKYPVREWFATSFDPAPWSLPLLVPSTPRPALMRIPDEPRPALAATIESPLGLITVVTTHLSFVPGYNVRQLRKLRAWLTPRARPLVLMGDFNLPGSLPRRLTGWRPLVSAATYPSSRPRVQFDHIVADGLTASASGFAVALPVSDHCALVADVDSP